MADYCGRYIYLNTHEFKNNIARWTRLLEHGPYDAILVKRHEKVVGVYLTSVVEWLDKKAQAVRARKEGSILSSPLDERLY